MVAFKKLALVAAGALMFLGTEQVQAAPMTEIAFVNYFSSKDSGPYWRRGAPIMMHFVNWRDDNPGWTVRNIAWVDRWAGDGGSLERPAKGPVPVNEEDTFFIGSPIPPWRNEIPEPGTALALTGLLGLLAMRRRTA